MSGITSMMFANNTPAAAAAGGDALFSNVQALLHFEGANASSTFTDSSVNSLTYSRQNSNTWIDTRDYKFGSASLFQNNNDDVNGQGIYHLADPRPSGLACQGDFTIEWWSKINTSAAVTGIFGLGQALFNLVFIYAGGSPFLTVEKSTSGTYASGFRGIDFDLGGSSYYTNWTHWAFVRNGNGVKFFRNGTSIPRTGQHADASTYFSDGSPSTGLDHGSRAKCVAIGDMSDNMNYGRGLRMDDFRFTNTARYTADFTAPAVTFPDN
jgi:hypothetical protein